MPRLAALLWAAAFSSHGAGAESFPTPSASTPPDGSGIEELAEEVELAEQDHSVTEAREILRNVEATNLAAWSLPFARPGTTIPSIGVMQALGATIEFNPQTLLETTRLAEQAGQAQAAAGEFDTTIVAGGRGELKRRDTTTVPRPTPAPKRPPGATAEPAGPKPTPVETSQSDAVVTWEAGLRRKFRNGVRIEPKVRFETSRQKTAGTFTNATTPRLMLDVVIPLGRGAGFAAGAQELAQQYDLVASTYALRNVTARNLADAIQAYWRVRAAFERVELLREAEIAAARIATISEALVEADELASSQLYQVYADQASAAAKRMRAEEELVATRIRLAILMGYPPEALERAPLAADPFPDPETAGMQLGIELRGLWLTAIELRDDLQAARELGTSRKVLLDAAYINLRPQFDVQLQGSWIPQTATSSESRYSNAGEIGGFVGFNLELPLANDTAQGQYVQNAALYQRSQLDIRDLERSVVGGVIRSAAVYLSTAQQVIQLRSAAEQYGRALDVQEELFLLGQGSLTDTITARQRLIDAQIEFVSAQERFASSIADLRYESGTMLPLADTGFSWIEPSLWTTPPFRSR